MGVYVRTVELKDGQVPCDVGEEVLNVIGVYTILIGLWEGAEMARVAYRSSLNLGQRT